MHRNIYSIMLVLSFGIFLSACTNPFKPKPTCPCKVKLVQLQEDGSYKTEIVEIKTLEDPTKMSSSIIKVTVNSKFSVNGSVSDTTPVVQFMRNSDDVLIPTTTQSSELFAIYKAMEELYFFDKSLGLDKLLSYPRVATLQMGGARTKVAGTNNAFYSPDFDRIIILKYSGSKLPLSINLGVLAHEHFHAIFNRIVSPTPNTIGDDVTFFSPHASEVTDNNLSTGVVEEKKIQELVLDTNDKGGFNYLMLMSLNEGLADYWAYLNTGQENPFLASLTKQEMKIDRSVRPFVFPMESENALVDMFDFKKFQEEESNESIEQKKERTIRRSMYINGNLYSNLLRSLSEEFGYGDDKKLSATWILRGLENLSNLVSANGKIKNIRQSEIVESFLISENDKMISEEICPLTRLFLIKSEQAPRCK